MRPSRCKIYNACNALDFKLLKKIMEDPEYEDQQHLKHNLIGCSGFSCCTLRRHCGFLERKKALEMAKYILSKHTTRDTEALGLMISQQHCNLEIIKYFYEEKQYPIDTLCSFNGHNSTGFLISCERNRFNAAKYFIENNCNIHITSYRKYATILSRPPQPCFKKINAFDLLVNGIYRNVNFVMFLLELGIEVSESKKRQIQHIFGEAIENRVKEILIFQNSLFEFFDEEAMQVPNVEIMEFIFGLKHLQNVLTPIKNSTNVLCSSWVSRKRKQSFDEDSVDKKRLKKE